MDNKLTGKPGSCNFVYDCVHACVCNGSTHVDSHRVLNRSISSQWTGHKTNYQNREHFLPTARNGTAYIHLYWHSTKIIKNSVSKTVSNEKFICDIKFLSLHFYKQLQHFNHKSLSKWERAHAITQYELLNPQLLYTNSVFNHRGFKNPQTSSVQAENWTRTLNKNQEWVPLNPLKTNRICFIQGLSAYRAVNTLHFGYKNQSLNVL
jgi:hypothetical protein